MKIGCTGVASLSSVWLPLLAAIFVLLAHRQVAYSQTVYSYVDENGIRVFTNIPPKNAPPKATPSSVVASPRAPATPTNEDSATLFDPIIEKYAGEYRLDPALVRSMIATESGFNHRAVSRKGALGLMQLMPATASRLGVRNAFDPEENIRGGMFHLRALLDTFGNDLVLSLAAYNAGENLVQRIGRIPNYPETHAYIRNITQRYGKKEMAQKPDAQKLSPTLFRFVDAQGILHLTNIPQAPRMDVFDTSALSQAGQSP